MSPLKINGFSAMVVITTIMAGFLNPVRPASCCGGGSSASLILPKFANFLFDASIEHEKYDGYWDSNRIYKKDPAGSDLRQLRMNLGAAYRLHDNIQSFISIPYVVNINQYTGIKTNTYGVGDTTFGFNFEAFNDIRCVYKVLSLEDLLPATYLGAKVTVPTGISPYDTVPNSFDITGLGFYTLNFSLLVDKTVRSFNLSLGGNYSLSAQRPVNREYGKYIEPYYVQPGGKINLTATTGYTFSFESMDSMTVSVGYTYLKELLWKINGISNPLSGFDKHTLSIGLAFAMADQNNVIKLNNAFNLPVNGWGSNKPVTFVTTLEYSHVIR